METSNQATSGAPSVSSGAETPNTNIETKSSASTSGDNQDKSYPSHFVEKLKKEKENTAKALAEKNAELERVLSEQSDLKEKKLAENEQFKTLWETEKQKSETFKGEADNLRMQAVDAKKRAGVKRELVRLGLNPEHEDTAFRLMDISGVMVDSETGEVIGGEDAVKGFYDQYKTLGIWGKPGVGVDQRAPSRLSRTLDDLTLDEKIELLSKQIDRS